ncbi:hypothetical protein Cni_G28872 [Canna indica]|uniref:Uncharacterized protein n=1 Tax=Canna indica TaxID=4628 RepID=A0AAQ3QTH4_9LILI|nr:hypothetical protein Cni_G28872 [Canna indica]
MICSPVRIAAAGNPRSEGEEKGENGDLRNLEGFLEGISRGEELARGSDCITCKKIYGK